MPTTFPQLKLTYFAGAGRAEATRLALHIGGVPFVDERLNQEEFAKRKSTFVYGQVPVLEVDGVEMAQSQAILRYAGKLAGLYPVNDAVAALLVDEILAGVDEMTSTIIPTLREPDAEKRKAMRVELAKVTIPRYLGLLEARLAVMKQRPIFQSSDIFIHELVIYSQLQTLQSGRFDDIPTNIADGYIEFIATANKVAIHPKVQQWVAMHATNAAPKLKLTYFDVAGRGEAIRMAFAIGDIPFEDERIDRAELAKRKSTLPFNQIPILDIDGLVVAQSLPILRYACTLAGLYPTTDPLLALRADELVNLADDAWDAEVVVFRIKDPAERATAGQTLVESTMPMFLARFEKRLAHWGGPYATGKTMTIADLAIFGLVESFRSYEARGIPLLSTTAFDHVSRVCQQVHDHEKAKAWRAQHHYTE